MKRYFQKVICDGTSCGGAVPEGGEVVFSIDIPRQTGVSRGAVRLWRDGETPGELPLEWSGTDFSRESWVSRPVRLRPGLYLYVYELHAGEDERLLLGGDGELFPGGRCQLSVYRAAASSSSSLWGKTIYHIFVDRFFRSGKCAVRAGGIFDPYWENGEVAYPAEKGGELKNNVFFGGDLYGVAEKLGYISSLGADYIYLSPVFSAASNHKYDVGDYLNVDPAFGGDEALLYLCSEAKKYGIGVILDGVFDHTGDDSVYFNKYGNYPSTGAYQSPDSPYFEWYDFGRFPDVYACWWNIPILPKVRSDAPSFRRFICEEVLPKWSAFGISGWRLDVCDELPDVFLDGFKSALKELDPDAFVIGEVWEDASNKCSYGMRRCYLWSGQLDSIMNYPFREAVISYVLRGDADFFRRTVEGILWRYPPHVSDSLMNFLGTHDTPRILTVFADALPEDSPNAALAADRASPEKRERAIRLTALAFMMTAILPGSLSIYYGDEAGMEGHGDPFCRRPFPWGREDKRLLSLVRKLGSLRRAHRAFKDGAFSILSIDGEKALFLRSAPEDLILCAVNRSGVSRRFFCDDPATDLFSGESAVSFDIPAESASYFSIEKQGKVEWEIAEE